MPKLTHAQELIDRAREEKKCISCRVRKARPRRAKCVECAAADDDRKAKAREVAIAEKRCRQCLREPVKKGLWRGRPYSSCETCTQKMARHAQAVRDAARKAKRKGKKNG